MSATGIGAAVRRREDQRFITGKGHYTVDISRPGETSAFFVRSPLSSSARSSNFGSMERLVAMCEGPHTHLHTLCQDVTPRLTL